MVTSVVADDPEGIRSLTAGAGLDFFGSAYRPQFGEMFIYNSPYPEHVEGEVVIITLAITDHQMDEESRNLSLFWPCSDDGDGIDHLEIRSMVERPGTTSLEKGSAAGIPSLRWAPGDVDRTRCCGECGSGGHQLPA